MFMPLSRQPVRHPSFYFVQFVCAALLLLLPLVRAHAQGGTDVIGTGGKHMISGRIYFPSGRSADAQLKVKLESTNTGGLSVLADSNGHFSFRGLSPGNYSITIEGGDVYETVTDSVYIDTEPRTRRTSLPSFTRAYTVTFHLQLKRNATGAGKPGVLNAALAGVPPAARDLYLKALDAARAGDSRKAVEWLTQALALHPNFALALNELGAQYLKLNQPDKAVEALRSALRLTPDNFVARLYYGIALLNQMQFAEAESQLRQALKKNEGALTAHMYLGIALARQRKLDEAEKELRHAVASGSKEVSLAHYYLGGIYWMKKDYKRAADELERYLALVPTAPDAEKTRATVKDLRNRQ